MTKKIAFIAKTRYKDVKRGPTVHHWNCDNCPLYRLLKEFIPKAKFITSYKERVNRPNPKNGKEK